MAHGFQHPTAGGADIVLDDAGTTATAGPAVSAPDGSLKWLGDGYADMRGAAVAANGNIIATDSRLAAYDETGNMLWMLEGSSFESAPNIGADGTIYAAAWDGLHAVSPDGQTRWILDGMDIADHPIQAAPPPLGDDGTIYWARGDFAYAINPDGTTRWKTKLPVTGGLAPILGDAALYVRTGGKHQQESRTLCAISFDGTVLWSMSRNDALTADPILDDEGNLRMVWGTEYLRISPAGVVTYSLTMPTPLTLLRAIDTDGVVWGHDDSPVNDVIIPLSFVMDANGALLTKMMAQSTATISVGAHGEVYTFQEFLP